MREMNKNMHFESLIKSFQFIIDITKKAQHLMRLTNFITFRNIFRVDNQIYHTCK